MINLDFLNNNQKKYSYNGHNVIYVSLEHDDMIDEIALNKCIFYLNNKLVNHSLNAEMLVFIVYSQKLNITYEYQIMHTYIKKIIHENLLLTEKDIMTKIEKRFYTENTQENKLKNIIKKFSETGYTISTMESCTGGSLAGSITNISGASDILHESYITYCNEAKIKYGVPKQVIDTYTVYSLETAKAMANAVKKTANSEIGIGITGQLGRVDPRNIGIENNKAWYCIKGTNKEVFAEIILILCDCPRLNKKEIIINEIINDLYNW